MEKQRGQGERERENAKGRVEDDRGGLQTSVGRHLGNDNALTATANKSKGGRRMRRGRDLCAEKHAHMDANKHANLRAKWDINKGNLSSKQKRLQCHYS